MSTSHPNRLTLAALPLHRTVAALPLHRTVAALPLLLLMAACSRGGPSAPPPGPPEVGVVTVTPQEVTLSTELPGRVSAFRVAEVRARASGIVLKRLFTEGTDVKQGQPLFLIDPAPARAALDAAVAQQARAEAQLGQARLTEKRAAELLAGDAASPQSHDDAAAALQAAEADLAAARAAAESARINLAYTTVTAPVAGRIGRAEVTEGAYVQAPAATRMAVIQQLDPVYVDVTRSSAELVALRRELEAGKLQSAGAGTARVTLVTEDGREYPRPGTLQFADVSVDPGTGAVALRAVFPNPKAELLAGMYVRARLVEGVDPQALLVPQSGVTRDTRGQPTALVVQDGKAELRVLTADRTVGDAWLVTGGLRAGDQVIVEGLQRIRPGAPVKPVPAAKVATAAAP
jgi:membrane fusion protein (multidrug efflux system)